MFECKKCDKIFANKSNLNRHFQRFHDDLSSSEEEDVDMDSVDNDDDDNLSMTESEEDEQVDDMNDKDVWKYIAQESEKREIDITEAYKEYVIMMKALKKDKTHQAVMQTLEKIKDSENMDFIEALDYSVHKRRFLINLHAQDSNDEDEAQNLFILSSFTALSF